MEKTDNINREVSIRKGYKGFDLDLCRNGIQFEIGGEYRKGNGCRPLELRTDTVFHYFEEVSDVIPFYGTELGEGTIRYAGGPSDMVHENRYCEVEILGDVVTDGMLWGTDHIRITRELTREEIVRELLGENVAGENMGRLNTEGNNIGNRNSGSGNIGNDNAGCNNKGSYNSGEDNVGDLNTGDRNAGSQNSGDDNMGNGNSGNRNDGDRNSGDGNNGINNAGDYNNGNSNSGSRNRGSGNSGDANEGHRNTGTANAGRGNSGDRNEGNYNTGHNNSGNFNTGDGNIGNGNTGRNNVGHGNTGFCNYGSHNTGSFNRASGVTGFFCTEEEEIRLFNKPSGMTLSEFENSVYWSALKTMQVSLLLWETHRRTDGKPGAVSRNDEEELDVLNKDEPQTGRNIVFEAVLRRRHMCTAYLEWWARLSDLDKAIIVSIPNFDEGVFKEITGLAVDREEILAGVAEWQLKEALYGAPGRKYDNKDE